MVRWVIYRVKGSLGVIFALRPVMTRITGVSNSAVVNQFLTPGGMHGMAVLAHALFVFIIAMGTIGVVRIADVHCRRCRGICGQGRFLTGNIHCTDLVEIGGPVTNFSVSVIKRPCLNIICCIYSILFHLGCQGFTHSSIRSRRCSCPVNLVALDIPLGIGIPG